MGDLEALIAAANDEEGDWSEGMAGVADLEAMAAQWGVERYVGHWDGYAGSAEESPDPEDPIRPNNYYLHSDEAGIFQFLPWGTDQAWEYFNFQFDEEAGGLMFNKCLADASCKDLYLDSLTDVHCLTSERGQAAHAAELAAMLAPYQAMEDPVRRGYTAEDIAEAVEDAEEFPELRGERLVTYLTAEGRLGEGLDPCAPPLEPETPDASPDPEDLPPAAGPTPPAPRTGASVTFGRSKMRGAFVVTRLHATGPGRVSKRVFAWIDGKRRHVCVDRSQRDAAGRHTVSCRLPKWALGRLEQHPLRLTVLVGFTPDFGAVRLAKRTLILPRR